MVKANASARTAHLSLVGLLAVGMLLVACGGGSDGPKVTAPLVRAFSPVVSPMDYNSFQQNPTFTDGLLTTSTDPNYPGKIVIFFQSDTILDPASVFVGGDPSLGVDLSSLAVLQYVPGTGNVRLPLASIQVEADRIICTPATLPLPNGQYSIGVFENIRSINGKNLVDGPVFQSFSVGASDTVAPFVVSTSPVDGAIGIGAGAPPPQPAGSTSTADVRTNIFGPTSPDLFIRFNEGIDSARVNINNLNVINAGFPPGAGPPPSIAPAPSYPQLKSVQDRSTLPSNGHEIVWRPDPLQGGYPFGTIVQCSVVGSYDTQGAADADPDGLNPDNPTPIADLSGNNMRVTYAFSFQTLAPPDLPQNPFPEYAIWWSASDRVGALDVLNQVGIADAFTGAQSFPFGIPRNVLQQYTDTVSTSRNIPGFEPTELSVDNRTGGNCHSWVYALSPNSGQIVVVNTRTSIPVALINTPAPGGISNQTGGGQAANIVVVTNSSANTLTFFDFSNVVPGASYVNGPIFIQNVQPTGNTPRAISMSLSPTGSWNRDMFNGGPPEPIIMYADFTDGVVNTTRLSLNGPVKQFNLGANAAPNDIVMSPCVGLNPFFIAAISEGGLPGEGKVAYYISGPGCITGTGSGVFADSLIGDLTGFEGPAGMDDIFPMGNTAWFAVAESGAGADRVRTLGLEVGAFNQPRIINTFNNVGQNPVAIAHRAAWLNTICIDWIDAIPVCSTQPFCFYNGTEQNLFNVDQSGAVSQDLYICARGAGQITVLNLVSGSRDFFSPIAIPGVRFVASAATQ